MPNKYSITIRNESYQDCWYTFFAEKPLITGFSADVFPTALHSFRLGNGTDGTLNFTDEFSAICCTSDRNERNNSTFASIAKSIGVSLGADDAFATFDLQDEFFPEIKRSSGGVDPRCFRVQTGGGFEQVMAQQRGTLIGVGINVDVQTVPMAVWHPSPGEEVQVRPFIIIHIVRGQFATGQLLNPWELGETCVADSSMSARKSYQVVHNKEGEIRITD